MAAKTLEDAVQDFYLHLESMGRAKNTIKATHYVLQPLMIHVGPAKALASVTERHISAFMLEQGRTRKGAGLRLTHSRLCTFFKWCVDTGRLKPQQNPMHSRSAPKVTKREMVRVPVSKFPLLLDQAEAIDPQRRAFIATGLYTCLRPGEIAPLRVRDLDLDAGTLFAVIWKTHQEDYLPISGNLDVELRKWLRHYSERCGNLRPDWYLFPRLVRGHRDRSPLGTFVDAGVASYEPEERVTHPEHLVKPVLTAIGVPELDNQGRSNRLGGHTLRRSGARALYDALVEQGRADALRMVQTLLHHASPEQTQEYIGIREDRENRDILLRGVDIFGFASVAKIGEVDGRSESSDEGVRHLRGA